MYIYSKVYIIVYIYIYSKGLPWWLREIGSAFGKESAWSVRDLGLTPGLRRSSGGGHDNSFQYSCLESPQARIVDIFLKVLILFAS